MSGKVASVFQVFMNSDKFTHPQEAKIRGTWLQKIQSQFSSKLKLNENLSIVCSDFDRDVWKRTTKIDNCDYLIVGVVVNAKLTELQFNKTKSSVFSIKKPILINYPEVPPTFKEIRK